MKRVSGYQTTDGKIFPADQKQQAREHQASLNVIVSLAVIGARIDADFGTPGITNGEQFAKFVLENADDIKRALAGKSIVPQTQAANEGDGYAQAANEAAPQTEVDSTVAEAPAQDDLESMLSAIPSAAPQVALAA